MEVEKVRTWDRHVTLRSRRWPGFGIQCNYYNKSFVTEIESFVRCNYSEDGYYLKPRLCHLCPLERTRNIWIPVWTEYRKRSVFVSERQSRKFWNWKKE